MARTESFLAPQFMVCRSARFLLIRSWPRFDPDASVLGCSVFVVGVQLPEPLTGNLWTLDDFEGNPALLVRHSSSPPEFFSSPVVDNGKCVPFAILLFLGWGISGGALVVCSIRVVPVLIGFSGAVCRWSGRSKTLLKLTIPRIKLLRNRRELQLRQMRRDIAKLLEAGQEATARIRVRGARLSCLSI